MHVSHDTLAVELDDHAVRTISRTKSRPAGSAKRLDRAAALSQRVVTIFASNCRDFTVERDHNTSELVRVGASSGSLTVV